jgi:hypothetical protein
MVWKIATGGDHRLPRREVARGALEGVPGEVAGLGDAGDEATSAARRAIAECVRASCGTTLSEALEVQTRHSAEFMTTTACRRGRVGAERARTAVS